MEKELNKTNGIKTQKFSVTCGVLDTKMTVEAGTTGYKGGDAGYGSEIFLKIKANDYNSSDELNMEVFREYKGFSLLLKGDAEISMLITALELAAKTLKEQAGKPLYDCYESNYYKVKSH